MACLGPCPSGKEGEIVTCSKGKSICPGRLDGVFSNPVNAIKCTKTGFVTPKSYNDHPDPLYVPPFSLGSQGSVLSSW